MDRPDAGDPAARVAVARSGLSEPLAHDLRRRLGDDPLAELNVDIEQARQTQAEFEDTTWGVELREIDGERFVVLPAGTLDSPPWTMGGRPAVKVSIE